MKRFIFPLLLIIIFSTIMQAQTKRPITAEDLWSMKRLKDYDISMDGQWILLSVQSFSMEENKGNYDIFIMKSKGSELKPLKNSKENETEPKFIPGTRKISFIKGDQLYRCDYDGSNEEKISDIHSGVSNVIWFNDGKRYLFNSEMYPECFDQECQKKKDEEKAASKVDAMIFEELFYRHWDKFLGEKRSRLLYTEVGTNILESFNINNKYAVPPISLGSDYDIAISPDGKEIAFTTNTDKDLAYSTNNEIYIANVYEGGIRDKKMPIKISQSAGNDIYPLYSPDGKYIAYLSMARAGFEADKFSLMLYDRNTGETKNLTEKVDISVSEMVWTPDSKTIYFTAANEIYTSIYKIDIETPSVVLIVEKRTNEKLKIKANKLYFLQQRSNLPHELFVSDLDGTSISQLTTLNKELLAKLEMNEVQTFWSDGAEGAEVQSILLTPPRFDETKKYPMIFLIHGGPQGHWEDDFHYRWNLQMFAAQGYVVVAPNPRGSTGYGQKFTDEITKDWGGKVYIDLMNAYDSALANYNYIDGNNTFAAGASYGGYMISWIAGHTDRFNALVNHDGVFNPESMFGSTEELWFTSWEFGKPWEDLTHFEKWAPQRHIKNFKTPMLVVHGGKDYRVPETQAFELFTALQSMNVKSKFLYFPNENHFVLKPQNARLWWNTIYDWFEQHKR